MHVWDGTEFQDYVLMLLHTRYARTNPHSFQTVPDRDRGDLGIEAFALDGNVYQCYAAEEPLSIPILRKHQIDKLTVDLNKLKANESSLLKLLKNTRIRRYVFVVHRLQSRQVVEHARKKAEEVRKWQLGFLEPDFEIVVETLESYATEVNEIGRAPRQLVAPDPVSGEDLSAWREGNLEMINIMRSKLSHVDAYSDNVSTVIDQLLNHYLDAENSLQKMRTLIPEMEKRATKVKVSIESTLPMRYPPGASNGHASIVDIVNSLEDRLVRDASLDRTTATTIAWAAIGEWLMRCPLDFGEHQS